MEVERTKLFRANVLLKKQIGELSSLSGGGKRGGADGEEAMEAYDGDSLNEGDKEEEKPPPSKKHPKERDKEKEKEREKEKENQKKLKEHKEILKNELLKNAKFSLRVGIPNPLVGPLMWKGKNSNITPMNKLQGLTNTKITKESDKYEGNNVMFIITAERQEYVDKAKKAVDSMIAGEGIKETLQKLLIASSTVVSQPADKKIGADQLKGSQTSVIPAPSGSSKTQTQLTIPVSMKSVLFTGKTNSPMNQIRKATRTSYSLLEKSGGPVPAEDLVCVIRGENESDVNQAVRALLDVIAGFEISEALHNAKSNEANGTDGNYIKMVPDDDDGIYANLCADIIDLAKPSRKVNDTAIDALINEIGDKDNFFNGTVDETMLGELETLGSEGGNHAESQDNESGSYRLFGW